jgi:hypothetical protein
MRKLKIKPEPLAVPSASEVIHRSAEGLVAELKVAREKPFSKTIQKAVERTVGQLSAEEKDLILQEMVGRRLEKLDVYYNDDIKMNKPLVSFDDNFKEKRSWGDRPSRGDSPRGKGGDRFRKGENSRGGFKHGKPKFGEGRPAKFGEGKPKFGEGKPKFGGGQSKFGQGKPAKFGQGKPFAGGKKKDSSEIRNPQ